jgi:ParB family chromosome partitioning protein
LTPRAAGPGGSAAAALLPGGPAGPPGSLGPLEARGPGAAPLVALAVPVGQLAPDPEQPRRRFSEERLALLAASVRACGVIHPLLVVPHPDLAARAVTPYQILVGERRWLAARRASLATVPAVVREERLPPADRLMLQIAESDGEHREELALFDLASAVARAFALARCTQVQFAQRHRRSQAWLCNLLRLAQAEGLAREALREGLLQGVLAALTYLRLTPGQQRHLLSEALETRLPITLRRAEKAAAETEDRRRKRRAAAGAAGAAGGEGGEGKASVEDAAGAGGRDGASGQSGANGGDVAGGAGGQGGADAGAAIASGPWGREAREARDGGEPGGRAAAPGGLPAGRTGAGIAAAALGSGAEPADFAAARARSGVAARSAGAGPSSTAADSRTPSGAAARGSASFCVTAAPGSRPGAPRITLEITVAQLETLLTLLGREPAGSPREMAEQLLACL